MLAVVSHIYNMQGTTPPAADSESAPFLLDAPQGEIYCRDEGAIETSEQEEETMEV